MLSLLLLIYGCNDDKCTEFGQQLTDAATIWMEANQEINSQTGEGINAAVEACKDYNNILQDYLDEGCGEEEEGATAAWGEDCNPWN